MDLEMKEKNAYNRMEANEHGTEGNTTLMIQVANK